MKKSEFYNKVWDKYGKRNKIPSFELQYLQHIETNGFPHWLYLQSSTMKKPKFLNFIKNRYVAFPFIKDALIKKVESLNF